MNTRVINGEEELMGGVEDMFINIPVARQHSLYLCGPILEPQHYIKWFHLLRHSSENDVIMLHINSTGGAASTAVQFMRAMADSEATIIASVEGNCMSAATMIFLAADAFQVSEHSMFMFHNYSGINYGKGGEMFDSITHERRWSKTLLENCYKDFLTPEEIASMLDGKDLWMDADEAVARLAKRAEIQEAVAAEAEAKATAAIEPAQKDSVALKQVQKGPAKQNTIDKAQRGTHGE